VTPALLVLAGLAAGVIGTAGGITGLVSYPALLLAGLSPLAANMTSSVALLGSGLGSSSRAAPDIAAQRPALRRWTPLSVAGSFAGAVLLIVTPGTTFDRVVPFLVALAAAGLLLQPAIDRWLGQRNGAGPRTLGPGIVAVALYNGYFGPGSGIMLIALLLLTIEPVLHRANSMKNVVLLASDLLPAVLFALTGHVAWWDALSLGAGATLGGVIGPSVARRVPHEVLRVLIACCGFALAIELLVNP